MEIGTPEEIWNCRIDSTGRIRLPKSMRSGQNWNAGDQISFCRIGEEIVLHRSERLLDDLVQAFRTQIPEGIDLVEELCAERREEAARETNH